MEIKAEQVGFPNSFTDPLSFKVVCLQAMPWE